MFDPDVLNLLAGQGDKKTLLMVLQGRAELIKDANFILMPEDNLLGEDPEPMSELSFQQTIAVQKAEVLS